MKITLESEYGTATVERDVVALPEVIEDLIIPVLLAHGFRQKNIDELLKLDI